jgi:hypothetical protein
MQEVLLVPRRLRRRVLMDMLVMALVQSHRRHHRLQNIFLDLVRGYHML